MENQQPQDPSANVILLVGNAVEHLKDLHAMGQDYYEKRLQLAVEASRRDLEAESRRIDGRQAADAEMVKVANQTAIKQAEALATQVAENAEALRASMQKTAEVIAAQLQQMTASLDSRLKIVEEKQYSLAGASKGSRDMWGWVSAGIILVIAVIGFISKW